MPRVFPRAQTAKWVRPGRDGMVEGFGPGERDRPGKKFRSANGRVYAYDEGGVIHYLGAGTR